MKILQVKASILGENSATSKLGDAIVAKLKAKDSNSTLTVKNVGESPLPHFSPSFFVPAESRTASQAADVAASDNAIAEVKEADVIVIGVPMYNFGISSNLKTWVDNLCRAGITFKYTEKGAEGQLTGKKVYLAIASGGIYTVEEMKAFDFTESYLRAVFGFLGLTDVTAFRVEGLAIPEVKEKAFEVAEAAVNEYEF